MIEGWRSKHLSVHLEYGLWYHSALEHYDKCIAEGREHEDALRDTVLKVLIWTWIEATEIEIAKPWSNDHTAKTRENLVRTVIWYLEQFGENDMAKTVILANGKPAVELSFRLEMDWGPQYSINEATILEPANADWEHQIDPQPYILSGHLDRVVEFNGGFYVMDRKTAGSTLGPSYFDQYEPDNQMDIYSFAAKVIYQTPVKGVIIDAAQIAVGFTRFSRGFTFRTEAQIEEMLSDMKIWTGIAEQYAIAGHWPMNTKSCHNYGGCVFRKVCSKSPEIRHKFLESDFHKQHWNPLSPR